MHTTSFNIPSISCSNCANKIRENIKSMNGINNVEVDLKTQTLKVEHDPNYLREGDISQKITSMGYEVVK